MKTKNVITEKPILLIDGHHGIYIPKLMALDIIAGNVKCENKNELLWELGELGNPDNECYWEAWEDLLDKAILLDTKGNKFTLYQNDDLWAIPEGYENEEFFNS